MATTLAERMNKFSGSPTSALIAKVAELKRQGKDIISLNVGEPDFGTPDYIKVAGMKAIADNFTKYTPGNGILELRQEIVKKLREDNGVEYALNEVTTAVGAKQAIASAMMVLAGPGDEVLLPIPCWVSYTEMIRLAGATPVFVPVREDNYELDLDAIEKAITPRTKAIVICTPNNPTGAVYSEESLRKLAALAVEHDFFVVADEIYEKLVYDGAEHFSVASISQEVRDRTVTVNGFSKAYAMTGWRIGYAAARADHGGAEPDHLRHQRHFTEGGGGGAERPPARPGGHGGGVQKAQGLCGGPAEQDPGDHLSRRQGRILCVPRCAALSGKILRRPENRDGGGAVPVSAGRSSDLHGPRRGI